MSPRDLFSGLPAEVQRMIVQKIVGNGLKDIHECDVESSSDNFQR